MLKRLLPLLLITLTACSSRPGSDVNGHLLTNIRPDGTKLFVFTSDRGLRLPELSGLSKPSRHKRTRDRRDYVRAAIEDSLDIKLEKTGFCRKGFLPLGHFIERGRFEIRGECNESATKEDRLKFSQHSLDLYH